MIATPDPATVPDDACVLPASHAQELLWIVHRAAPQSVAYNVPRAYRLHGRLDDGTLQRAFDALVERHEILRTTYAFAGEDVVQIIHAARPVPLRAIDLRGPAAEIVPNAERVAREIAREPFDLGAEAPFRVALLRLADDDHMLLIATHHIASDGWSGEIMLRDLSALYAPATAPHDVPLPDLPIQFADYASHQREQLRAGRRDAALAYWKRELDGADDVVQLPVDYERSSITDSTAVSASIVLPADGSAAIKSLGRSRNATLYMTLLAAYQALLHRYSGQSDILVGSPIAGRDAEETHDLIGYFANTIVLRARFDEEPTFTELLERVRVTSLRAYDHHDVPFETLVLERHGRSAAGTSPLVQTVFTMLAGEDAAPRPFGNLELVPFALDDETTKFDLTLFAAERNDTIVLTLRGRAAAFRAETMHRMLGHLRTLLAAAVDEPNVRVTELPLLARSEREDLARWNDTGVDFAAGTVVSMIAEAERRDPNAIALRDGSCALTYRELGERSRRLAAALRRHGAGPGRRVAVMLDRSASLIVAFVAVLESGAAYVPLAVDTPAERLQLLLDQTRPCAALSLGVDAARFGDSLPVVAVDRQPPEASRIDIDSFARAGPDDPAYILFTSGSTGFPKGVTVTHGNLANYVRAVLHAIGSENRSFGMISSPAADLGNTALYPALCSGATLRLISADAASDPARFADELAAAPLDVLKITPAHMRVLLDGAPAGRSVLPQRWLIVGGETAPWELAEAIAATPNAPRFLNHYGPTETTVGASIFEVTPASQERARASGARSIPIGMPLANVKLHVVDECGALVPVGVTGELLIGGAGVSAEYLAQPALTAERFFRSAHFGRVYRTGDRVRRLPDGALEFVGRLDDQVKIRGFRVELGEIEAALAACRHVANAAAILRSGAGEAVLAVYAVATAGADPDIVGRDALAALKERLPDYMLPASIAMLDALPLTPNGKVDRAALAASATENAAAADRSDPPATPTEIALATIWSDVLRRDNIRAGDDFFALGGHSLLAIRVLGKISRIFGVRLPLRALFDTPILHRLAEVVDVEVYVAAVEGLSDEQAATLLAASGRSDG